MSQEGSLVARSEMIRRDLLEYQYAIPVKVFQRVR